MPPPRAGFNPRLATANVRQVQKLEAGEIQPGNITLANALKLAAALGIEPAELMHQEG